MNLGDAVLADLSPQIQAALKDSKSGDAAAPFMSEAGVELITPLRQARPHPDRLYAAHTASRSRTNCSRTRSPPSARRYLRDLRRDSNIQVRDDSKTDAFIR